MTHYLLTVHGPAEMDEYGSYGSKEEMEAAFAATGAFNDKLHADGYWVFAGGLQSASTATVVDGQGETGTRAARIPTPAICGTMPRDPFGVSRSTSSTSTSAPVSTISGANAW